MFEENIRTYRRRNDSERNVTDRGGGRPTSVAVTATRPSRDFKLGIGLAASDVCVKLTTVSPDGLLAGTELRGGMVLETVNGTKCATAAGAMDLLKAAEGRVAIVASDPGSVGKGASPVSSSVVVVITKPSKDAKLGLDLGFGEGGMIDITAIDPKGPIADTDLRVGMKIDAVNGKKYITYNEGMSLLKEAKGDVRIVASDFDPTLKKAAKDDTCCILADGCCAGVDCCCECTIM